LPEGPPQGVGSTPLVTYTNAQLAHTVIGCYTRYSIQRMEKMFTERGLENLETYYLLIVRNHENIL
jgi:hypothetical protein